VLVLGDAILDEYLSGDCSRLSPEAPVPVLAVRNRRRVLGGAANTAANVRSLGGVALLVARVGDDEAGTALAATAELAGIEFVPVRSATATLRKVRVVSQQQQLVRLDFEENPRLSSAESACVVEVAAHRLAACDIVVISDYAKGFVSADVAQEIIARARTAGKPVVIDPRPQNMAAYRGCDYITPNWREACDMLGLGDLRCDDDASRAVARDLGERLGCHVVLTLGAVGIRFFGRSGEEFGLSTVAREVYDVSGAGDTVVAAFALALAAGADHPTAVDLANRAAGVVVGKFGTATVSASEILSHEADGRLVTREALARLAEDLRARGRRIVTTNGTFDLLHAGHLAFLEEARRQGDVLVVGVNSDASVRTNKGPDRPVMPEEQRAQLIMSLRPVDYVHIFDEPDPRAFIAALKPDVHVNGTEYGEDCIERSTVLEHGGRLHLVDRIPGLSSSDLGRRLGRLAVASSVGAS
jgi:D-beta-D-heptose 7-phosphate kinase/D-beta-D-heptose 1-phosphate adenosyltransferase